MSTSVQISREIFALAPHIWAQVLDQLFFFFKTGPHCRVSANVRVHKVTPQGMAKMIGIII